MKLPLHLVLLCVCTQAVSQTTYSGSFVATLGVDTVIVETYNIAHNHLYGKAFLRYPEDQIGVFNFHFYPEGNIKHYSIAFMDPDSNFISKGIAGAMCEADSCTWYSAWPGTEAEYERKHPAKHLDFIGGWTPTLSLIEWNCMRLLKSGQTMLPMILLNDYIGVRDIALYKGKSDTILFGGPFLEYTKITTTPDGRIKTYDGTGTPWNYIVTPHEHLDVDVIAKRLSKSPKIGVPSPEVKVDFVIQEDTIKLSYGRPAKRGRKIFGGVVPYDSLWRTGAGDPTKIDLPYSVRFGKTLIPKGRYSLYTVPRVNEWLLIFNTDLKQWPTDPDRSAEFAKVPMKVRAPKEATERFTINIEPAKKGGILTLTWDDTEAHSSFEVVK
jgi:hypothetical protein